MSKKKLLCLALVLCMILPMVLTGCANTPEPTDPTNEPTSAPTDPTTAPTEPSKGEDEHIMSPDIVETMFVSNGMNGNYQYKGKFYTDYSTLEEAQAAAHALAVQLAAEGIHPVAARQVDVHEYDVIDGLVPGQKFRTGAETADVKGVSCLRTVTGEVLPQ